MLQLNYINNIYSARNNKTWTKKNK